MHVILTHYPLQNPHLKRSTRLSHQLQYPLSYLCLQHLERYFVTHI